MKKFLILSLIALPALSRAQASVKKATNDYNNYSYAKVIDRLEDKKGLGTASWRELAESYKMTGDYANAEIAYAKVVAASDKTPQDVYAFAQVLKMNGRYEMAQQQMDVYASMNAGDSRVQLVSQNKSYAIDLLKDKGQFEIKDLAVNSAQQDFGAVYYKDQVVYTSSRHDINSAYRRWNGNGLPFLDLYVGTPEANGEISKPEKLSKLDKKYHEGPATYSKDGNTVIYTEDNYREKSSDGVRKLELMESHFKDGKWSDKVPFPLNNKDYSVAHPSLSADGNTLYFASDMPGGKGGVDLYKVTRNPDGSWGKAENLGDKINTEGNEEFPFIHESGLFFFASDGRPGLGGLDIFATQIKDGQFSKVINPGVPLNSSKDDFTFALSGDMTKGYFASNREGGKGDDDIYSFVLLKPFKFGKTIKGTAKDKDGAILAGVLVELKDNNGQVVKTVESNADGSYSFEAEDNMHYGLKGSKDNYFDGANSASTNTPDDVIVSDLQLEKDPGLSLYALVTDAGSKQPLEGVKVTMLNNVTGKPFDDFITPASGDHLKPLAANKIGDHLSYTVKLEKPGYLTKTVVFNYDVTKAGEIKMNEALDLSIGKMEVGGDLAKMIDIKPIYFDLGKYNIRKDAAVELDKIVKIMNEYPGMVVELGSHTDCRGSAASNMKLSDNRAKASATYIKKHISKPERIYGKGYGESKLKNACACEGPVKSTCTEEEHQQNRRTEFIIVKLD